MHEEAQEEHNAKGDASTKESAAKQRPQSKPEAHESKSGWADVVHTSSLAASPYISELVKLADSWQPHTIWPAPESDLERPKEWGKPDEGCTCEYDKLKCPVHGMDAQGQPYEHLWTIKDHRFPDGDDANAPRTWLRSNSKVAAETKAQALRRKEFLDDELGPDKTTPVHEFPDGWKIHRIDNFADMEREGQMMGNCFSLYTSDFPNAIWRAHPFIQDMQYPEEDFVSRPEPEEMHGHWDEPIPRSHHNPNEFLDHDGNNAGAFYSLRDPSGIPHASIDFGKEETLLGRHNANPKPEYVQRVKDWTEASPDPYIKSQAPDYADPDSFAYGSLRKVAEFKDDFHIGLYLPTDAANQIHQWAKEQTWPEGTELEPLSIYHITLLFTPDGRKEVEGNGWPERKHHIKITGIKALPSKEHGDADAIVLVVEGDDLQDHHEQLADRAKDHGLDPGKYAYENYTPHITIAYGELPDGLEPPEWEFETEESRVSPPRIEAKTADFFHLAPTTERERIRQHGLQPTNPKGQGHWEDLAGSHQWRPPEGVYAFPEGEYPDQMEDYRRFLENERGIPHDVWRIPQHEFDPHPDPDIPPGSFDEEGGESEGDEGAYYSPDPVHRPSLDFGPEHYVKPPNEPEVSWGPWAPEEQVNPITGQKWDFATPPWRRRGSVEPYEGIGYHGSSEAPRIRSTGFRRGWLTSEPKEALQYASEDPANVVRAHVRLEKPLHMTPEEAGMDLITGGLQREAQKMGYDGLVIHKQATGPNEMEPSQEWDEHHHIIPFDHAKSVTLLEDDPSVFTSPPALDPPRDFEQERGPEPGGVNGEDRTGSGPSDDSTHAGSGHSVVVPMPFDMSHYSSIAKFGFDEVDTREYDDNLMMPPTTPGKDTGKREPHHDGIPQTCTCQEGHKLDCPIHGMNPIKDYDAEMSWSIPEGYPVGLLQDDQPKNYMKNNVARLHRAGLPQYAEMVPVEALRPFRDMDRKPGGPPEEAADPKYWEALKNHIATHGFEDPLTLEYSPDTGRGLIGEGNHRLGVAEELGLTHVPTMVYRRDAPLMDAAQITEPGKYLNPNEMGHSQFPQYAKPSEIGLPTSSEPYEPAKSNWYQEHYGSIWKVASPITLYHGTTAPWVDSYGLQEGAYLAKDPELARWYAQNDADEAGGEPYVWAVKTDSSQLEPDKPSLEEPVGYGSQTSDQLYDRVQQHPYVRNWEQDKFTGEDSLDLVGTARHRDAIPPERLWRVSSKPSLQMLRAIRYSHPRKQPPHLKDSTSAKKHCGNCEMFDHQKGDCWGYGNWHVREDQVCDSWSKET